MTKQDVEKLIKAGECINIEFKESKTGVNGDLYQTICAFLNRIGGHILLGVDDIGKIVGVKKELIPKIKKEIVTTVNNSHKINPPTYVVIDDIRIKGKSVIVISVPESSQVHRCNNKIYDRNQDADLDITNHRDSVAMVYFKKQTNFSENKIFHQISLDDFNVDVMERAKKMIKANNPNSPLPDMNNLEMLKSLGFYQRDMNTGKEGFTLGALLLFGKDNAIYSLIAYYKTDAIVRIENIDRYDDREIVNTNLIDSFDMLMQFIIKHLSDPFYLEDDIHRVSLRDKIFREVISNILIHREYLNPLPGRIIIEKTKVIAENANRAHGFGHINPQNLTPFSKNPKIARVFRDIGRADELGSGTRNIFKYVPVYSKGAEPQLIEEDIFRTIIPLMPEKSSEKTVEKTTQKTVEKTVEKTTQKTVEKTVEKILILIRENPKITMKEMEKTTGLSRRGIEWNIAKLKKEGKIKRIGPDRGGYWDVIE